MAFITSGGISVTFPISQAHGGTALTAGGTANQILGENAGATALEYKTVAGTANRVTVTHAANLITLSGPQDLAAASSPTFAAVNLSNVGTSSVLWSDSNGSTAAAIFENAGIPGFANLVHNAVPNAGIQGRHTFRINGVNRLEIGASTIANSEYAIFGCPVTIPTVRGGGDPSGNLELKSTTDATKGAVVLKDGSSFIVDWDGAFVAEGLQTWETVPFVTAGYNGQGYGVITNLANGGTTNAGLTLAGGQGTWAAPAYLDDGQAAGSISFAGANDSDTDIYNLAGIQVTAALDQSNSNHGGNLNFYVTKSNSSDDQRLVQFNGSNGQMISDFSIILRNSTDPGGVSAADIALYPATASGSGVSTVGIRTAEAVAVDVALASTHSLKIKINGVEYKLALTAV